MFNRRSKYKILQWFRVKNSYVSTHHSLPILAACRWRLMSPLGEFQVTLHPSELQRMPSLMISTSMPGGWTCDSVLLDACYSCPPFSPQEEMPASEISARNLLLRLLLQHATATNKGLLQVLQWSRLLGVSSPYVLLDYSRCWQVWNPDEQSNICCASPSVCNTESNLFFSKQNTLFFTAGNFKLVIQSSHPILQLQATVGVWYCFMNLWMLIVLFLHRKSCRILHCLCLTRSSPFTIDNSPKRFTIGNSI